VPAAVHAVLDALSTRGVSHIEMPMTPERIWRALRGEGA
jgi:carbon-monoxide dehydrogenase large subunit